MPPGTLQAQTPAHSISQKKQRIAANCLGSIYKKLWIEMPHNYSWGIKIINP